MQFQWWTNQNYQIYGTLSLQYSFISGSFNQPLAFIKASDRLKQSELNQSRSNAIPMMSQSEISDLWDLVLDCQWIGLYQTWDEYFLSWTNWISIGPWLVISDPANWPPPSIEGSDRLATTEMNSFISSQLAFKGQLIGSQLAVSL